MAEVVPESDAPSLRHVLSEPAWSVRAVPGQVAREADGRLGGSAETGLLIDESGMIKKGRYSVGVARPWNGRMGVVGVVNRGDRSAGIDARPDRPIRWGR